MSSANWVLKLAEGQDRRQHQHHLGHRHRVYVLQTADNRYFDLALKRGLQFDGSVPMSWWNSVGPDVEKTSPELSGILGGECPSEGADRPLSASRQTRDGLAAGPFGPSCVR